MLTYSYISIVIYSGNACRMKVMKCLRKDFKSINEAEEAYNIDYFEKEELSDSKSVYVPASEIVNHAVQ